MSKSCHTIIAGTVLVAYFIGRRFGSVQAAQIHAARASSSSRLATGRMSIGSVILFVSPHAGSAAPTEKALRLQQELAYLRPTQQPRVALIPPMKVAYHSIGVSGGRLFASDERFITKDE